MTTPKCEDAGPLKEWAPPTALLESIPARTAIGLFNHDINFTCIAALCDFIAVGTNSGAVYWYNRETHETTKLSCWCVNTKITCLQIVSTVDYMVAAGSDCGVKIFRIPKVIPDSVPERIKPKEKKKIQQNSINLHKSTVTALEWSKNGMHLFSGDNNGLVVVADFDYYNNTFEVTKLCNEKYPIVQLSCHRGLLLISTTLRTILLDRCDNNRVTQIGQRERKYLGPFGAIFRHSYTRKFIIYATRPGFRIWEADRKGTVLKTLMFKDAIKFNEAYVKLLNPAPESVKNSRTETAFGKLLQFNEDYLITYNSDIIYIVNPQNITVTAVTDVRRVTDVACTKEEIFIVEGDRNIIRISYYPDTTAKDVTSFPALSQSRTAGLLELTTIIAESKVLPVLAFSKKKQKKETSSTSITLNDTTSMEANSITDAEEAVEIPSVFSVDCNTDSQLDLSKQTKEEEEENKQHLRRQIFEKISEQDFEDVVFTPEKKNKKLRSRSQNRNKSKAFDDISKASFHSRIEGIQTFMSTSIDDKLMIPSPRDLESIQRDVENKEKLLAHMLDFDLVISKKNIDATNKSIDVITDSSSTISCSILGIESDNVNVSNEFSDCDVNHSHIEDHKNEDNESNDNRPAEPEDDEVSYQTVLETFKKLVETNKKLTKSKSTFDEDTVKTPDKIENIEANYQKALKMLEEYDLSNEKFIDKVLTESGDDKDSFETEFQKLENISGSSEEITKSILRNKELVDDVLIESENDDNKYVIDSEKLKKLLGIAKEITTNKLRIKELLDNSSDESRDDETSSYQTVINKLEVLLETNKDMKRNKSIIKELKDNISDESKNDKISYQTILQIFKKLVETNKEITIDEYTVNIPAKLASGVVNHQTALEMLQEFENISQKLTTSELDSEKFIDNAFAELENNKASYQAVLKMLDLLILTSEKIKRNQLKNDELIDNTPVESRDNKIDYSKELTKLGELLENNEGITKCKLKIREFIDNASVESGDDKDCYIAMLIMLEMLEECANEIAKNKLKSDQLFSNASDKLEYEKMTYETVLKMLEELREISKKEGKSELKTETFIDKESAETGNNEASHQTEFKKLGKLGKSNKELMKSKLKSSELISMEDLQDVTHERTTRNTNSDSSWSDLELDLAVLNESITASNISEDEDWVLVHKHSPKIDTDQIK
ncbi:WD repeat-containing protein CG11141 [Polistes fuscatus]|uniref:WD repeat-containing protein CG11141 n=1 Tax=Polistes fuscatus TaxID=30207 RepID=UPI001CA7B897|nr:WD repeat-containing protein CG11141 [Polistes fuscatus]XP_043492537.1 WD repeat-containing protein CG11141 [Polistes fuscatus]